MAYPPLRCHCRLADQAATGLYHGQLGVPLMPNTLPCRKSPPHCPTAAYKGDGYQPLAQEDAAFLRHWGLAVALADLREVVRRARAVVGPGKFFLGGHSLGGMLAQCYAAWAFPEGPGHGEIDGLVLIDGAVG